MARKYKNKNYKRNYNKNNHSNNQDTYKKIPLNKRVKPTKDKTLSNNHVEPIKDKTLSNNHVEPIKDKIPPKKHIEKINGEDIEVVDIEVRRHYDSNGGHPHGIMDEIDDNYISVGFTHDKEKGKGHNNYKLKVNPLGKNGDSYMHKQATVDKKTKYGNFENGIMAEKDYEVAKTYAERAKEKYKKKKK